MDLVDLLTLYYLECWHVVRCFSKVGWPGPQVSFVRARENICKVKKKSHHDPPTERRHWQQTGTMSRECVPCTTRTMFLPFRYRGKGLHCGGGGEVCRIVVPALLSILCSGVCQRAVGRRHLPFMSAIHQEKRVGTGRLRPIDKLS